MSNPTSDPPRPFPGRGFQHDRTRHFEQPRKLRVACIGAGPSDHHFSGASDGSRLLGRVLRNSYADGLPRGGLCDLRVRPNIAAVPSNPVSGRTLWSEAPGKSNRCSSPDLLIRA
jgi:hypothetical protein